MANHICSSCGKSFASPVSGARFCSRSCYYVARRKRVATVAERFWKKAQKGAPGECWAWAGATHKYGYGRMSVGEPGKWRVVEAHCVSWELHRGPIPEGMHVCHSCDNPPCCNPAHLFLGTNTENRRDSKQKGRQAKGERSGHAKLTAEKVRSMRRRYAAGGILMAELAEMERVSPATAQNAIRGLTWKHVTEPI